MKVLVIGSGGREHALAWKIAQSPLLTELYVTPGNPGMSDIAKLVDIRADDVHTLLSFARNTDIDLTIVGPEKPLAMGIVNRFQVVDLPIFGPRAETARIESSKVYAKELMGILGIPFAPFASFSTDKTDHLMGLKYHICNTRLPFMVKVDGLADGKGAVRCDDLEQAFDVIGDFLKKFGDSAKRIIVEEFLSGQEISIHALCDGKNCALFPASQDHKAAYDNDQGPNTGGMGVIAPVPWFTKDMANFAREKIVQPILDAMSRSGHPFTGLLYPGLMVSEQRNIKVLEYNVRFGDPETQALLPLLKTDLLAVFLACMDKQLSWLPACTERKLSDLGLEWNSGSTCCVVIASKGYPGDYSGNLGHEITGIEEAEKIPGVKVFHAGTKVVDGKLVNAGGRVLNVVAHSFDLKSAIDRAYAAVSHIHFEGMHFRTDIGAKAL